MPRKRTKKARRDTTTAYTNKVGETGGRTTRKGHTARISFCPVLGRYRTDSRSEDSSGTLARRPMTLRPLRARALPPSCRNFKLSIFRWQENTILERRRSRRRRSRRSPPPWPPLNKNLHLERSRNLLNEGGPSVFVFKTRVKRRFMAINFVFGPFASFPHDFRHSCRWTAAVVR